MNSRDIGIWEWIKREEAAGNIYEEMDGMWVWAPWHTRTNGGFLNEYALTQMAEYLTARNAYWTWQINHDPAIGGSI
jgi:hypothetical protein